MSAAAVGGAVDGAPRLRGFVPAVAALAGACTMVVELAAVRLLAPWFGTSAAVWTNVIGVILFALACGYLLGARLAAGSRPLRSLAAVLGASALLVSLAPALAGPVAGLFLPAGLTLHQAAELWLWGSLAATLGLFFVPAALLGCVGPLLVELLSREGVVHAGSAGGRVLCASTLGSLAGTFATTHALIPRLGLTWTFLAAGLGLLALTLWSLAAGRNARAAPAVLATAALVALLGRGHLTLAPPPLAPHLKLLAAVQSPYQELRVVEDTSWDPPLRMLQVNEGLDSFQSVWAPEEGLLGRGFYYDYFALPAWWSQAMQSQGTQSQGTQSQGTQSQETQSQETRQAKETRESRGTDGAPVPWRVLVLGLGAGTTFRVLRGASPEGLALELTGVEIDPAAVALGRRWFELDDARPGVRVIADQDARAVLAALPGEFDLVVLDAYANQVEIPAHLSSREFFARVRARLAPGGWIAINVGAFGADDPVLRALGASVAAGFDAPALAVRVPFARNWIIYARSGAPLPDPSDAHSFRGPVAEALLPALGLPGASVHFEPGDAGLLSDDRNPIDILQRASLEQGRARLISDGS